MYLLCDGYCLVMNWLLLVLLLVIIDYAIGYVQVSIGYVLVVYDDIGYVVVIVLVICFCMGCDICYVFGIVLVIYWLCIGYAICYLLVGLWVMLLVMYWL